MGYILEKMELMQLLDFTVVILKDKILSIFIQYYLNI